MTNENIAIMDIFLNKSISEAVLGRILPAKNVLVLAPHHDDEVLGCGGTLLKYLEQDTKVTLVYLTDGRYGIKAGESNVRKSEAILAWSSYKEVNQTFCDFTDSRLSESKNEAIDFLKEILSNIKPEIIYTPWIVDRHVDHTYTSLFLADSLEAMGDRNCIIASYEVAFPLFANHTVNITKQWDKKLELIDVYKSQKQLNIKQFITSLNIYRAQLARLKSIKVAESFYLADVETYKCFVNSILNKI